MVRRLCERGEPKAEILSAILEIGKRYEG